MTTDLAKLDEVIAANAWVVVSSSGNVITSTVADKRVTAIKRMVGDDRDDWRRVWRWWKRNHGCRCERVALVRVGG